MSVQNADGSRGHGSTQNLMTYVVCTQHSLNLMRSRSLRLRPMRGADLGTAMVALVKSIPADGSELGWRDSTQVHHGIQQAPVVQLHHKLADVQLKQNFHNDLPWCTDTACCTVPQLGCLLMWHAKLMLQRLSIEHIAAAER